MARKPRYWFRGAKYHITTKGIRGLALFHDTKDYETYLELLAQTQERFPFYLHAYCQMTNHIHLQIETIHDPPSVMMKHLNQNYAMYFNKRHDYAGCVFASRYHAELIDTPAYEIDSSRYIHLNPLTAGMVSKLEDYPWSSYRAYAFCEKNPLVTTEKLLSYFPEPHRIEYDRFLHSKLDHYELNENGIWAPAEPKLS